MHDLLGTNIPTDLQDYVNQVEKMLLKVGANKTKQGLERVG